MTVSGRRDAPSGFTQRQGEYLAFIHRYTERHGIAPSFPDLARQFGTSTPSVHGMIKTLERRGRIANLRQESGQPIDDEILRELPGSRRTKIRANAPCPCGSGRKYKACCGP